MKDREENRGRHTPGPWIEVLGPADRHGRRQYFIHWVATYHPGHPEGEHRIGIRGQIYFANPIEQKHDRYVMWPGKAAALAMALAEKGA